ncbi:alkaline phosphatase [Arthrobacter sp. A2-55]|uniref:alkaline phosphatase n=1 Tax=Arthrobacter sp. A2-55 TaxID=2897337 RepID=UPI0021CD4E95|nr:alkaline phosphatase [Arthrobacter sp. A2-55]MCU6480937.1 alkaline phosphatase [Arthrobacter sp. A2-55]
MQRKNTAFAATSVVLALGGALLGGVTAAQAAPGNDGGSGNNGEIKNVIYLLGDGMGRTHVTAGRERFYGAAGKLNMETLPAHGYVSTYAVQKKSGQPGSADFALNLVTDSASAATAWASGVKTYNAALGVDAKGTLVPTAMEMAKQAGYRTGNVSTAEITDATPAAQMSHALARGCQGPVYSASSCQDTQVTGSALPTSDVRVTPIAKQIARNGTADVILGGGLSRFDAADETALKAQGYSVISSPATQIAATKTDLAAAQGQKVFGLFNSGNLTVEKTKQDNPSSAAAQEPTVADMTEKAISLLSTKNKGSKGFYLQVEGALIDKRSHANDASQTLEEIKAFDDAVKVALDFAKKDGHTLVIVTADHECAGFNIIEKGSFTNAEAAAPPTNVDGGNTANNSTPSRASGNVKDSARSTGIVNGAGSADPKNFAPATFRTPDDGAAIKDGSPDASLWLTYLSGNHTGADVPVYSYGAGSEKLQGTVDNTDLFGLVTKAMGLTK